MDNNESNISEEKKQIYELLLKCQEKDKIIDELQTFSDQIRVNLTLYQGFKLSLDKLTQINEKLDKLLLNSKNIDETPK